MSNATESGETPRPSYPPFWQRPGGEALGNALARYVLSGTWEDAFAAEGPAGVAAEVRALIAAHPVDPPDQESVLAVRDRVAGMRAIMAAADEALQFGAIEWLYLFWRLEHATNPKYSWYAAMERQRERLKAAGVEAE